MCATLSLPVTLVLPSVRYDWCESFVSSLPSKSIAAHCAVVEVLGDRRTPVHHSLHVRTCLDVPEARLVGVLVMDAMDFPKTMRHKWFEL